METNRPNVVALQIAARQFVCPRGHKPVVWLTGVSHIGDSAYYEELQKHLDGQTLVLYEGVGAAEAKASQDAAASPQAPRRSEPAQPETRGSLQSAMAASLGLVFQLEAIDYRRDNFRNSDLSLAELRELLAGQSGTADGASPSASFEGLIQLMQGNSWLDELLQMGLRLLGTNPKFQALGRLALIDLLGGIQGDPSRLQGLPPDLKQLLDVLLVRRNEKVIADLESQLATVGPRGSIAVFFGTGHMPDLETRLREQLHYVPAKECWFTTFQVDLAASKVSESERKLVEDFVGWQLKAAGGTGSQTPR